MMLTDETTLDVPVNLVLERALDASLTEVIVIGYDKNDELYFASASGDAPSILWAIEKAKETLLKQKLEL